ncbi:Hypothetical predicted protein [Xyrichtys novacula]|uniref:Uncharacterized protein n=1 Tax=Xyrichtys novacula TaxID=13765 RepID=A0AAV1GTB8_XYRNO|nr:Hypothetical predicted protein [Xyrichtys novacula]
MAKDQRVRTSAGVTAIWTTNQANEINTAFDWSKGFSAALYNNIWLAVDSSAE